MNVNVKVNFGPKTRAQKLQEAAEKVEKGFQSAIKVLKTQVAEDSPLAQKLQGLAEKAKKGFSAIESDMKELVQEAQTDPELDKFIKPLVEGFSKMLAVEIEIALSEKKKNSRDDGEKQAMLKKRCPWCLLLGALPSLFG